MSTETLSAWIADIDRNLFVYPAWRNELLMERDRLAMQLEELAR